MRDMGTEKTCPSVTTSKQFWSVAKITQVPRGRRWHSMSIDQVAHESSGDHAFECYDSGCPLWATRTRNGDEADPLADSTRIMARLQVIRAILNRYGARTGTMKAACAAAPLIARLGLARSALVGPRRGPRPLSLAQSLLECREIVRLLQHDETLLHGVTDAVAVTGCEQHRHARI